MKKERRSGWEGWAGGKGWFERGTGRRKGWRCLLLLVVVVVVAIVDLDFHLEDGDDDDDGVAQDETKYMTKLGEKQQARNILLSQWGKYNCGCGNT